MEYPADESTMEDNANAVDETNNAASPENVSSSDYAEATDAIGVVTQILTLNCMTTMTTKGKAVNTNEILSMMPRLTMKTLLM